MDTFAIIVYAFSIVYGASSFFIGFFMKIKNMYYLYRIRGVDEVLDKKGYSSYVGICLMINGIVILLCTIISILIHNTLVIAVGFVIYFIILFGIRIGAKKYCK